jgi:hypothetical protein
MKKKIFWKIYLCFVLLALIVMGVVWYRLYDFLGAYEAAQPEHTMENVLAMFTDDDAENLLSYTEQEYSPQKTDEVLQSVSERLAGKNFSFTKKIGTYTNDAPAYSVRDDDGEVCVVYLKALEERAKYNSKVWELDRIENLVQQLDPVRIIAPENAILLVNGEEIDDSCRVDAEVPEELTSLEEAELIQNYTEFPQTVTYELDELYVEPEVVCYTPDGSVELEPSVDAPERTYEFDPVYYETMDEDMAEQIREFAKKYVNYVTKDETAATVLAYVLPDSLTYTRLEAVAKMNVWTPRHSAVQFSDMELYDYRTYSDTFFTCKLSFTYLIPYMMGDSEYETCLTFYYVKADGEWKIADMLIE